MAFISVEFAIHYDKIFSRWVEMKKIFLILLNIILCACSYSTPSPQDNELSVQDSQKIIVSGNDIQSVELTNEEREIFSMQSLDHNFKSDATNFLPSKFILGLILMNIILF